MTKQTKYVFVTGGVASGLGKGITAASLGRLLKARGYKVANQKFDPYINIDPSMMSPIQHGEIFVTDDGAECDADVGHYERFTDETLTKNSNITSGKIYQTVIEKERAGEYNGKTVQVIPHITDHIKYLTHKVNEAGDCDVIITEIGGTVGDMESRPFIEAIRQIAFDVGRENVLYVHVTLLPYLEMGSELKTKPTQHSVKEYLSMGIQPDMIVCRTPIALTDDIKSKIALFCNVSIDCIIENSDADNLYRVPLMLEAENFAATALKRLGLPNNTPDLSNWEKILTHADQANTPLTIALVGKYTVLPDAYLSLMEALKAASFYVGAKLDIRLVSSEDLEKGDYSGLDSVVGMVIGGGFGERGSQGKILAATYARTKSIPCFGLGMGMQAMTIEFARNLAGLANANSQEFDPQTPHQIFDNIDGELRLGAHPCTLTQNTLAHKIYKTENISERHRHRFELNSHYAQKLQDAGLTISGHGTNQIGEIIELANHPFYLGVVFDPQFKSRPTHPHPIFTHFLKAALALE